MNEETVSRSGVLTTEFWCAVMFVVVILANGTQWVEIPGDHIMLLAAVLFGYGGGRMLLKNTGIKANAQTAVAEVPAVTPPQPYVS